MAARSATTDTVTATVDERRARHVTAADTSPAPSETRCGRQWCRSSRPSPGRSPGRRIRIDSWPACQSANRAAGLCAFVIACSAAPGGRLRWLRKSDIAWLVWESLAAGLAVPDATPAPPHQARQALPVSTRPQASRGRRANRPRDPTRRDSPARTHTRATPAPRPVCLAPRPESGPY